MKYLRFMVSLFRLRSVSLALWVWAYDNFKPTHKK